MTTELKKYLVLRGHEGDRIYTEGETREANPLVVSHLVGRVLELIPDEGLGPERTEGEAKSEEAPQNKAEDAAPANKASAGRKVK